VGPAVAMLAIFASLILGLALVGKDVASLVARPITLFVDVIYGTGPGRGKPPLNYRLARGYVAAGRFDDAVTEYQRIMRYYPRELEPYSECIRMLLEFSRDHPQATRCLRRGLRHMRNRKARDALRAVYRKALASSYSSQTNGKIG
jgi:hypothetical protein